MRLIKFHPIILCLLLVLNLTTNAFANSYLSFQNSNNDSQQYEIIIALNCNECINCYYDFNLMHSEPVIDKPYFSIRLNGNTFYGLVSDDESIRIKSYTLIDE